MFAPAASAAAVVAVASLLLPVLLASVACCCAKSTVDAGGGIRLFMPFASSSLPRLPLPLPLPSVSILLIRSSALSGAVPVLLEILSSMSCNSVLPTVPSPLASAFANILSLRALARELLRSVQVLPALPTELIVLIRFPFNEGRLGDTSDSFILRRARHCSVSALYRAWYETRSMP